MSNSIIEAIKTHIETCSLLQNGNVNVDYVGTQMSYSIDPLPCDPIVRRYTDGGGIMQFQFAFTSKEVYDEDDRITIENSGFCQQFEEWMEQQNMLDTLPELPKGKSAFKYETMNKGYLFDIVGNKAKYRIECRLIYTQEV